MWSDTFGQRSSKAVKERPISAPSRVGSDEIFTQQRNQLIVTVQIENVPALRKTGLQKNNTELERSWRHVGCKIVRTSSLNENSFRSQTKCDQNGKQGNARRSRSVPIILTNVKAPKDRTTVQGTVDKLTLSFNRYKETKL